MNKITWLGQAGILIEKDNYTIMVDPYLSNSCAQISAQNERRVPVEPWTYHIKPDMIICTHNHMDHLDPETLCRFLSEDTHVTVLCSENGFPEVRKYGRGNNCVMMHPGTVWTEAGITFTAVPAYHSETTAIGIIIDDGEQKLYMTGDTLYNKNIFHHIPDDIYALFLPVNGLGNNMNMTDAAHFARRVNAKYTVPLHCGLFDDIDFNDFEVENKVIPEFFKEIIF